MDCGLGSRPWEERCERRAIGKLRIKVCSPGFILPLYTTCHAEAARRRMVTFTRIPYATAARRARAQDSIVYAALIIATMSILSLSILLSR